MPQVQTDQLTLSTGLTAKTKQLCLGLESGAADILEQVPDAHRDAVFAFVRGNVCNKSEIGLKATGNGMIAITNWHLLNEGDVAEDVEEMEPGLERRPARDAAQRCAMALRAAGGKRGA